MLLCVVAILLMGCGNERTNGKEGYNGETKEEAATNEKLGTMKDYDGNTYKTVKIGKQEWMAENMRATHDRDGNTIALGSETSYDKPYRYCPDDNSANVKKYGYLYNWAAAMKVCPMGWHLPTDEEWKKLEMEVGMSWSEADGERWRGDIAAKLCADGGWSTSTEPNAAGNRSASDRNASGFSSLPAGSYDGGYYGFGVTAIFRSATENGDGYAYGRLLGYSQAGVYRATGKKNYFHIIIHSCF